MDNREAFRQVLEALLWELIDQRIVRVDWQARQMQIDMPRLNEALGRMKPETRKIAERFMGNLQQALHERHGRPPAN